MTTLLGFGVGSLRSLRVLAPHPHSCPPGTWCVHTCTACFVWRAQQGTPGRRPWPWSTKLSTREWRAGRTPWGPFVRSQEGTLRTNSPLSKWFPHHICFSSRQPGRVVLLRFMCSGLWKMFLIVQISCENPLSPVCPSLPSCSIDVCVYRLLPLCLYTFYLC